MSGFEERGVSSPAVLAPPVELTGLLVGGGAPVLAYGVIRWVVPPPAGSGAASSSAALVAALVVVAGLVVVTFPAAGRGPRRGSVRRGVLSGTAVVAAAAIGPLVGWWPGWVGFAVFGSEMVVMDVHSVLSRARRWRLGRAQLVDDRREPAVVWLLERRRLVAASAAGMAVALPLTIWFTDRHRDVYVFTFTIAIAAAAMVWMYRRAAGPLWGYVASETAPLSWRRRRPTTGAELAAAAYRHVGIGWAADPVTQHCQGLAATVPVDDLRPGDVVFWRAEPDGDGRPGGDRSALYAGTSGHRGVGALGGSESSGRRRDRLIVDVVDGRARLVPLPEHDLVGAVRPVAAVAGGIR